MIGWGQKKKKKTPTSVGAAFLGGEQIKKSHQKHHFFPWENKIKIFKGNLREANTDALNKKRTKKTPL